MTWYYTLDGTAVETDIVKQVTLDIGGGQFHSCTVTLAQRAVGRPLLRMEAQLLDEGTIALARAVRESLRSQHPGIRLSDAEAQQVLVSGSVVLGGRRTPVNDLVADVIATRSQKMLTHLRHVLQEDHSFLLFTGGGSILLERSLHQLVSAKRNAQSFLFVPKELASVLNAIGGYVLAQTAAHTGCSRRAGEGTMSGPISLRNLPPEALRLAATLSEQTGLSIADVYRKAIVVGLLIEATTLPPGEEGTLVGLEPAMLAKALRRYLSSALDLPLEHGEHPPLHLEMGSRQASNPIPHVASEQRASAEPARFEGSIAEDVEALGFGFGLSEAMESGREP